MAIVYRGMWSDSDVGVGSRLRDALTGWLGSKSKGQLGLADGTFANGAMQVKVKTAEDSGSGESAFWFSFVESRGDGTRWTTTVRHWFGPAVTEELGRDGSWIWVDLDVVAHDELDRVYVAAPRFVRELLEGSHTARRRCVPLVGAPITYEGESGAEQLAEIVTDPERDMPVVVFAPLPADYVLNWAPPDFSVSEAYARSVKRAVDVNAGIAQVCLLDEDAMLTFGEILGDDYGVRDGAFRIYLPGTDPAMRDAWRHRYTVASRYLRNESAGAQISRVVSPRAGVRRAPASYETAAALLESGASSEDRELLEMALAVADDLERRHADLDQRYQNLVEEQQFLEEENNQLRQRLSIVWKENALLQRGSSAVAAETSEAVDPADIDLPSTAALLAQMQLSEFLSFPDGACIDLGVLDTAVEAKAWGQRSWRAFLALYAYGEALRNFSDTADFWTWCVKSGDPRVWPANTKKLAMSESETLMKNPKFAAKRNFPVDFAVHPSGRVEMQAHIKIAEGGGSRAPRIYFLPVREHGKVYVGYFGPHKNVPNSQA
ncbi:hypothetical protein [Lentzea sp. NPDC004782]|uniref:hypothetical protein n=1 Tax=Lentzea sp. NPDC004782 TaxID=3154458 RepID=UPI0033B0178B